VIEASWSGNKGGSVAQECFVCGEEVRGIGIRGINKQGRRTAELTDKLRAAAQTVDDRGALFEGGDNGPLLNSINGLVSQGEVFVDFWHGAIHGDVPDGNSRRIIKSEWNAWGKDSRKMVRLIDLPPEQLKALILREAGN
jgi:hypothetical protein